MINTILTVYIISVVVQSVLIFIFISPIMNFFKEHVTDKRTQLLLDSVERVPIISVVIAIALSACMPYILCTGILTAIKDYYNKQ